MPDNNLVTQEEAEKLWCVRPSTPDNLYEKCSHVNCMAWRWTIEYEHMELPENEKPEEPGWVFVGGSLDLEKPKHCTWERALHIRGFCGLAGKPKP